jgi:hypothetical protein
MAAGAVTADEGPYAAAWRRYRWWSGAFWIVFLSFLPVIALVSRAPGVAPGGNLILVIALVWMIVCSWIGYVKWNVRCPRCGELFFRKFDDRPGRMVWQHNPFARRCMHCGLPKWAARDPELRAH